ncbi:MAG: hypothetical protein ACKOWX_07485 [Flavobacteriales bacterium]
MKNVLLLSVSFLFLLGACTIQKRVYQPGYTVEWKVNKFGKTEQAKQTEEIAQSSTEIEKETTTGKTSSVSNSTSRSQETNNFNSQIDEQTPVETIELASNSSSPSTAAKKVVYLAKANAIFASNEKNVGQNTNTTTIKYKASVGSDDEGGNGALKAIGWVFIILGIILLLFISILVGILLMLLGLLFFVVGKSS